MLVSSDAATFLHTHREITLTHSKCQLTDNHRLWAQTQHLLLLIYIYMHLVGAELIKKNCILGDTAMHHSI